MALRILLVDDAEEVAAFILRGLRQEGYTVELASEGAEGWRRMSTETWDLILLDRMLPGMDGLDLLRRYRAEGFTAKVMFLTARDEIAERVEGLDSGADDYLCKPFSYEELLARVRTLARRGDGSTTPVMRSGDLVVDLSSMKVTRNGRRVSLTAREFALLAFLLRRKGEVVSKTRIMSSFGTNDTTGFRIRWRCISQCFERSWRHTARD